MAKLFSIREHLQGTLQDYIRSTGFSNIHIEDLIRDLVCLLASYREEDKLLFPVVFVADSLSIIASVAPGVERLTLGQSEIDAAVPNKILKECATLASSGWSIYIARIETSRIEYGLFRSLRHSYATSAEETVRDLGKQSPVIFIRNSGHLVVELNNSQGEDFTASFTSNFAAKSPTHLNIDRFSNVVVSKILPELNADFHSYLNRILTEMLQRCHGTLLAAIATPVSTERPETLSDGVWLNPPLDWHASHVRAHSTKDADTLSDLQAIEALVEGMLNSDGVILFGTDGKILAYRVFLKPTDAEKLSLPEAGGGRRRTYELMKLRVSDRLEAAFFRSQDQGDCATMGSLRRCRHGDSAGEGEDADRRGAT